jgi:hypothetical protein
MRTEAEFTSAAFNTSEVRPYFINDCCFGDDLAKWMIARLRAAGIETDDEPEQEDFGWYFDFKVPEGTHCCVVGYQGEGPGGSWLLWLERSRGPLGSLLGMRKRGIHESAVRAIDAALSTADEVKDLRWLGT